MGKTKWYSKPLYALLALTLVLLLGVVAVPPMAETVEANGTDYYVRTDGSNSNDGTANDAGHAWLTIQYAVDSVNATDTINVAAGTYSERVEVTKSLTLEGAGSSLVTVTSPDFAVAAFTVRVNNVEISGFTAIANGLASIWLDGVSGCTIADNVLAGTYYGIHLATGSDGNTFTGNDASNQIQGFSIEFSDDNIFTDNIANGNAKTGFYVEGGIGNTFTGNTASQNTKNGFKLVDGADNTLNYNNIYGNALYGVKNCGSTLVDATNNWWGDENGPTYGGVTAGDNVTANVDFTPWLDAAYPGGTAVDSKSGSVTNDTLDAKSECNTEVEVTGSANVTVAEYPSDPSSANSTFTCNLGKYIDVHIDDASGVTELEIRLYYNAAEIVGKDYTSLKLECWNGTAWVECSDTGVTHGAVNGYSGYIWAKIRNATTPTLAELVGMPFGGGSPPAPVGGEAYPVNKLAILAPWIALGMAIIAGSFIVTKRRRAES